MNSKPTVGTSDGHAAEDALADEFGDESFPGSDPPATWAGPDTPHHE
ncbi:MAG: hypothetical protein FWE71_04645 [Nocardioidaceae bacterium]|nr:hypothetical protein [Nocardioidaceae bacterium]MCL2612083.1 hypothetical protein [Nocardioidaceae bacterium]